MVPQLDRRQELSFQEAGEVGVATATVFLFLLLFAGGVVLRAQELAELPCGALDVAAPPGGLGDEVGSVRTGEEGGSFLGGLGEPPGEDQGLGSVFFSFFSLSFVPKENLKN